MEPAIPPRPPEPPADEPAPAAEPAPPPPAAASIPGQRSGSPRATRPAEPAAGGDPGRSDRRDAPGRDGTGREPAGAPATGAEAEAQAVGQAGADGGTEGSAPSPDAAAGRAVPAKTAARKTAKAAPAKAAAKKGPAKKAATKKAAPGTATALPDAPPEAADRTPEQAAERQQQDGQRQQQDGQPPRAATPGPAGTPEPTLWERLRSDPAHAPEILALAAVEWLGPEAERYAGWARATYPGATGDRLAQSAGRRFAAQARSGALAGVIAPEIGQVIALGWLQARLVLHVAAAYGRDARAPERAAELLVLLRVHDDLASARGALATAGDTGVPPRRPAHRLAWLGTRGVARRLAARLIPGAGVLVDLLVNDASMEHLTRRAISFYRTPSAAVSAVPTAGSAT